MNNPQIVHLVIDLSGFGGAEMTLLRYLSRIQDAAKHHRIITLRALRPGPSVGEAIKALGIQIDSATIDHVTDLPFGLWRLVRLMRASPISALSAWLYYPALLAIFLRPLLSGTVPIIWHIRSLPYGGFREKPVRWLTQRLLALFSTMKAVTIVSNSDAARDAHHKLGYETSRWLVIPNAIDPETYRPDHSRRHIMRSQLALDETMVVIGAVGRDAPEKAYPDLIDAFAYLRAQCPPDLKERLLLVIAGRGVSLDAPHFSERLALHQIPYDAIRLLGARSDIPDLMTGFDLFVMPSRSESFPNALAEAMATSLPAIATDVGDCRLVLDQKDWIVPKANPQALSRALLHLLSLTKEQRHDIGVKNRTRVIAHYAPDTLVRSFERVFSAVQATEVPSLK